MTLFFLLQAEGANERRARRGRGGPKVLETVSEEHAEEEEQQKVVEEPIAEPSPAPTVEEPKPAAKVTRAKRGKKTKVDTVEERVEEPVAAPAEPAQDGK